MFTYQKQITNSDIDQTYHVKTKSIIDLLQDAEGLHIDHLRKLTLFLEEHHAGIFLTYRQVNIYRRSYFKDLVRIETFPYETNPFFGFRNTAIYDENNQLLVSSYAIGPFVYLETAKPCRISQEIIDSFDHHEKIPMKYTDRKIIIPSAEMIVCEPIHIKKSHIDRYNHVNNSFYVLFAEDVLPSDFDFNVIRAEYRKAVKVNQVITPHLILSDKSATVVLKDDENTISCIVQFILEDDLQ